jgi:5-hydroxyisourate hydrolase-like protein (transthyretin family)
MLGELKDIVNDTLDLAKVRAVDIDALDATVGGLFPASILPSDASRPGWARNTPEPELAEAIEKTLSRILTGTVNVLVTEVGGKPCLQDVRVSVRKTQDGGTEAIQEASTNKEGRISFSNSPIGNLTLTAQHPGYHEHTQGITLLFDETKNVEIQLAFLPGTVEVMVSQVVIIHNGPPSRVIPAYGATVTLGTLTGKTDAKGFYRFATVKPGQYQVTASLPPYAAAPKVVVVKGGGDVVTVNIFLKLYR